MKKDIYNVVLACGLIGFGVLMRLVPHSANITPVTAIALFASAYLGLRYSGVIVLIIMLVSDVFVGFYSMPILVSVYGSFILVVCIGRYMNSKKDISTAVSVSLISSLIFFVVTNWAVWQFGTMYQHSLGGLIQSYMMGIPFFKNSLIGDIFYTGLLFVTYQSALYIAKRRFGQVSVQQ